MGDVNREDTAGLVGDYKKAALGGIGILEACMEKFSFSEATRKQMNLFFEHPYPAEAENITRRIAGAYMSFLGKTNFKVKTCERNSDLFIQLKQELDEVKISLSKLD